MILGNVLSLFDGCSCGQQALERAGIKVDKYFASEIDKYAIKVTMANYPETIQLGSVVDLDCSKLPEISLLCGGSPCQSFSFAGKRKGMVTKCDIDVTSLEQYLKLKKDGYEFEGQSYLFWEYVRVLREVKPRYFLLENVMMEERWEKIITKAMGIKPIIINSALVSAQNRKRNFWTNIGAEPYGLFNELECTIPQPKDRGILLKDVLQDNPNAKYYTKHDGNYDKKAQGLRATDYKGTHNMIQMPIDPKYYLSEKIIKGFEKHNESSAIKGNGFKFEPKDINNKGNTITSRMAKMGVDDNYIEDGKTYCLDAGNTNAVEVLGGDFRTDEGFRWRGEKTGTLAGRAREDESCGQIAKVNTRIRRLTPLECERLQTMADNYTNHVSDSARYKMIGNGWTVEVIAWIFSHIK